MKARARISARTEAIHAYPHVCGRGRSRRGRLAENVRSTEAVGQHPATVMIKEQMSMFDRILVPLDRSLLVECVLPHAVAVSHCLGSQMVLLRVVSLLESQERLRLRHLPALCSQARPALSHLTSRKPAQARKRLTPGAKKRIMQIDICSLWSRRPVF